MLKGWKIWFLLIPGGCLQRFARKVDTLGLSLRVGLGRALQGQRPGCLDRSEEMSHVQRKIVDAVIVGDCSCGADFNALLSRVGRNMRPDRLEKIEDVSTAQVCRCGPFFSS